MPIIQGSLERSRKWYWQFVYSNTVYFTPYVEPFRPPLPVHSEYTPTRHWQVRRQCSVALGYGTSFETKQYQKRPNNSTRSTHSPRVMSYKASRHITRVDRVNYVEYNVSLAPGMGPSGYDYHRVSACEIFGDVVEGQLINHQCKYSLIGLDVSAAGLLVTLCHEPPRDAPTISVAPPADTTRSSFNTRLE